MGTGLRKFVLRNCVHGSDLVLMQIEDENRKPLEILKSSSTPDGIKNLVSEKAGLDWYLKNQTGIDASEFQFQQTGRYARLRMPYLDGKKYTFHHGLLKNRNAIAQVIRHYVQVWGKDSTPGKLAPLHGDLSIDNVLFLKDGAPVLLDWEHFSLSAAPIGFDALYLLFESLWFDHPETVTLSSSAREFVKEQIQFLKTNRCLDEVFGKTPLQSICHFMDQNAALWGEQFIQFRGKFPILRWSQEAREQIDRQLT